MTDKVKLSVTNQISGVWVVFIFVILMVAIMVGTIYSLGSFLNQSAPEKFPEQPVQALELNEYYSEGLSEKYRYDTVLSQVASIRAISGDSVWGRTYVFEYSMKDGSKFIGIKPKSSHYQKFPKQFVISRINNDYLSVLIETDGAEYGSSPSFATISDFHNMVRFSFEDIENKDVIAKRWKTANDLIKSKRSDYAQALEEQNKLMQAQKNEVVKMHEAMDGQIETVKFEAVEDKQHDKNHSEDAAKPTSASESDVKNSQAE